ncbi:MAG: hypothetical protein BMS9Abin37_1865 [Acidobacteriota bacterium]|nr:MAG: hypothetical protein BMS9Abin37_1865 [Acidobacteriota bacterium]
MHSSRSRIRAQIRVKTRAKERGSAFVISILILFVLTVLGMALMLTTTTEKDIAINYRWGEQAFFNADAALEYGKNVLAAYLVANSDFSAILPPPRSDVRVADANAPWGEARPDPGSCDPTSPGCRDYQYFADRCPSDGANCVRVYIGLVLRRDDGTLAQFDFRSPTGVPGDLDGDGTSDLEGTTTLWVRRPVVGIQDYGAPSADLPSGRHDRAILTAEGTAPGAMGAGAGRPVSVRRLEMTVRRPSTGVEGDIYDDPTRANSKTRRTSYDEVRSDTLRRQ